MGRIARLLAASAIIAVMITGIAGAATVAPLAMTNVAIGGGPLNANSPGVTGGVGLNNLGLLIRTTGTVNFVDTTNTLLYIDDGSGANDGSGHPGMRVSYAGLAAGVVFAPPAVGTPVAVTAIVTTYLSGTDIRPVLRVRGQTDVTDMTPAP